MRYHVSALVVVVACGSKPPPSSSPTTPAATIATEPPADDQAAVLGPAELAQPTPEPPPSRPVAPPKPTKPPLSERLRDRDGKVAGLAGFSIKRKADATRCGGFAIVTTRAKQIANEDRVLAAVYKLEFPAGLDFSEKKKQSSMETFNHFLAKLRQVGEDATKHYTERFERGDIQAKVAAAARLAQINFRFASLFVRAPIPKDVRTGEFAAEKIDAFCTALGDQAEPLQARGEEAAQRCAEIAPQAGPGWWNEVCVASNEQGDR